MPRPTALRALLPLVAGVLVAAASAAQAPPDTLDLFVIAGQSNAVGVGGDPAQAPVVPFGTGFAVRIRPPTTNQPTRVALDPIGTDTRVDGTLAPAFAAEYVERTGRRVAFLQTAAGGTANVPTADTGNGHWSARAHGPSPAGGPNRLEIALDTLGAVYAALQPTLPRLRLAGLIWVQGERDAQEIDRGDVTADEYREELLATMDSIRTAFSLRAGAEVPLYVVRIGYLAVGDSPGFVKVREVQTEAAFEGHFVLGCEHGVEFPGLGLLADYGHWNQEALNHVGAHVGKRAAADAPPPPPHVPTEAGPAGAPPVAVLGNPARGRARFSAPVTGVVVDALGREVARLDGATATPALPPGAYALRSDRGTVRFTVAR